MLAGHSHSPCTLTVWGGGGIISPAGVGGARDFVPQVPHWTSTGFTLLEVLVALALVGVLFVAMGAVLHRQMGTQHHLEESLAAAQVGWNQMALFRADGQPITPMLQDGEEQMAGVTFVWSRQIRSLAQENWYQVTIRVGEADTPLHVERWRWVASNP